jgi:hypothetical protein
MKVIIFKEGEHQIYLHINKIKKIYTHGYTRYTQTIIHTNKDYQFVISDFQHGDFNQLIYNFIKSDKKLEIIKIKHINHEVGGITFTLTDWVSEAMGK